MIHFLPGGYSNPDPYYISPEEEEDMKATLIERIQGRAAAHRAKTTGDHMFDADLLDEAAEAHTELIGALQEMLAADDAMLAFLLASRPEVIGEDEWSRQHKERSDRHRKAAECAREVLQHGAARKVRRLANADAEISAVARKAERERCATIVKSARQGEIDSDLRTLIFMIEEGDAWPPIVHGSF